MTTSEAITAGKYVALTTFRKDGTPVPTPVWFALDGSRVVVQTPAGTGKLKRLRRDTRVVIAPCDMRGRVPAGAPEQAGTAEIVTDAAEATRLQGLLRRRYGFMYTLAHAIIRPRGKDAAPDVMLRVTLD
ncbi:PPOX class F420-dependent oxidoreductase [Agromyces allii]|uniref:PPOX class F420-dependent oxidoreductase n=1 Tax=Agromyces allii TaxID=393607 RepID=A0ABN2Q2X9_9MICO|nr:PPOX class F420-dependent oxidoreductase [Agromyces allii]